MIRDDRWDDRFDRLYDERRYGERARKKRQLSDVLVILPGILGSVLEKDGKAIWALSGAAAVRALTSLGKSIQSLKLVDDQPDVDDLGDGVVATRLISDLHLVPGLWKIDGYSKLTQKLKEEFELIEGENYFEFPYDWRRDNRVAARRLREQSHDWLKRWREKSGNNNARLILIAHSMGGLVARCFLEPLEGWRDTRMLVTFGTPYRGSVDALSFLVNGFHAKLAGLPLMDLSEMLRSLTSVYQLLPTFRCFDPGNGRLITLEKAGQIPGIEPERVASASNFHQEIQAAVKDHQTDERYHDLDTAPSLHPIVGARHPTQMSARLIGDRLKTLVTHEGKDLGGDGTVPKVSAVPHELSNQRREIFSGDRHSSLQNSGSMLIQLAEQLIALEVDQRRYYGPIYGVSVDIEDVFRSDEPITIKARPDHPAFRLQATITDSDSGEVVANAAMEQNHAVEALLADDLAGFGWRDSDWMDRFGNQWQKVELPPLKPGAYRVEIHQHSKAELVGGMTDRVADVFAVL